MLSNREGVTRWGFRLLEVGRGLRDETLSTRELGGGYAMRFCLLENWEGVIPPNIPRPGVSGGSGFGHYAVYHLAARRLSPDVVVSRSCQSCVSDNDVALLGDNAVALRRVTGRRHCMWVPQPCHLVEGVK